MIIFLQKWNTISWKQTKKLKIFFFDGRDLVNMFVVKYRFNQNKPPGA